MGARDSETGATREGSVVDADDANAFHCPSDSPGKNSGEFGFQSETGR